VATLLRRDDIPGATRAVLSIRQEAAKSSTAKLHVMQRAMNRDGRIRGLLQYMGARQTGRWAGRLLQPHNFPKGHIKPDDLEAVVADVKQADAKLNFDLIEVLHGPPLDVMASLLRGCIVAAPGHDFIVVDFSAIEARILAWLANERELLHLFSTGGDPYRAMAARVYGVPRSEVTADQRFTGKTLVLSCGYQCGWENLRNRLEKENIYATPGEAREYIDTYRRSNQAIVNLWASMQDGAMEAIRNPGVVYRNPRIAFVVKNGFLWMKLPSGRLLAYMRPSIETVTTIRDGEPWTRQEINFIGVDHITYRWAALYTYGGKLTENAVQAIARDVLAAAMLRAEARGYKLVLHVHDELVTEVRRDFGDVAELESIAAEVPPWLAGCPIKAEGWRGPRYRK
jgi:DNA polymerase